MLITILSYLQMFAEFIKMAVKNLTRQPHKVPDVRGQANDRPFLFC
jgi:hypothetical protein